MNWFTIAKALPSLLIALAVLAVVGVLAALHHMDPADAYGILMVVIGGTSVAAGGTLVAAATPNSQAVPHFVIAVCALALVCVLGVLNIFSSIQVSGVVGVIIGGGALAVGMVGPLASTSALAPVTTDPVTDVSPPPAEPAPDTDAEHSVA